MACHRASERSTYIHDRLMVMYIAPRRGLGYAGQNFCVFININIYCTDVLTMAQCCMNNHMHRALLRDRQGKERQNEKKL